MDSYRPLTTTNEHISVLFIVFNCFFSLEYSILEQEMNPSESARNKSFVFKARLEKLHIIIVVAVAMCQIMLGFSLSV